MSEHIFTLPDLGEGTVEAEVSEWHVKVGDVVKEDQPLADMLTDKAAVEVPSPVDGIVKTLGGELGDIIAVGAPLVIFTTDGGTAQSNPSKAAAPAPKKPSGKAAKKPKPAAKPAAPTEEKVPSRAAIATIAPHSSAATESEPMPPAVSNARVLTSPAIRRLAREHQVDLGLVSGSGPRGRIMRDDFDTYVRNLQKKPAAIPPAKRSGAKEIKVIGMRRLIAQRMTKSKTEIPHFSYVEEIDITELDKFRKQLNRQYAAQSIRFSYLPLLIQAAAKALIRFPQCNATYDKERNVLIQHAAMHAGVAAQTPDGLKVPVVPHAEAMNLPTLANEIIYAASGARDGSAPKSRLTGSTITFTSLGKLGGIASTPVINQPEVSIIGVNRAVERPMIVNGGIHIRLMMNISASFDHRFVDGYDAAEFIQAIKLMLEDPTTTFAAG